MLDIAANGTAIVLTLFGVYIVVMNYWCAIASVRNKRKGLDRHYSMIPLVAQVVFGVAYTASSFAPAAILPGALLLVLALSDLSLWSLLWLPFHLLLFRRNDSSSDQNA